MDSEQFWNNFLSYINSKLNNISFNTWFEDAKLYKKTDTEVVIIASSTYKRDFIKNLYTDLIEEAILNVSGKSIPFDIITPDEIKEEQVIVENYSMDINEDINTNYRNMNSNLRPEYTFDNFMVGDSNRFAQTVALGVAEKPGQFYNPLFLYGKSGLGKTHLMHAIGNYIVQNSNKSVLYVTSETFISDFTGITKNNRDNFDVVQHFKDKYRNIDVLMIDDIQLLGGASKTQDEFFNTFNFLHGLNKQIIIASDRSPDDLKLLEDRLRTRFTWGLTADIKPPDYELKLKILKNKMIGHETATLVRPEVLDYIANNCQSDVRHLEGCINKLYAYKAMYGTSGPKEITLDFAKEALFDFMSNSMYITNDVLKIQKACAEYYDVTVENLKSKKRIAIINKARQVAMYMCKFNTEETMERIGLEFNRDHATVIHACDKIEADVAINTQLAEEIKEIKEKITD